MINFFPLPLLAGLAVLAAVLLWLQSKRHGILYLVYFSVFWIYLLLVVGLTLFPIPIPFSGEARQSIETILSQVYLVPFYFGRTIRYSFLVRSELVGNILLTIPFGFGFPTFSHVKARNFPWFAVGIGLTIELAQLLASFVIGASYRVVDINDVLLNAAGAFLGYGLYRGIVWLRDGIVKLFKTGQ